MRPKSIISADWLQAEGAATPSATAPLEPAILLQGHPDSEGAPMSPWGDWGGERKGTEAWRAVL